MLTLRLSRNVYMTTNPSRILEHHGIRRQTYSNTWIRFYYVRELQEIENNNTWELCDLPPGKRALKSKWVYTKKESNKRHDTRNTRRTDLHSTTRQQTMLTTSTRALQHSRNSQFRPGRGRGSFRGRQFRTRNFNFNSKFNDSKGDLYRRHCRKRGHLLEDCTKRKAVEIQESTTSPMCSTYLTVTSKSSHSANFGLVAGNSNSWTPIKARRSLQQGTRMRGLSDSTEPSLFRGGERSKPSNHIPASAS